MFDHLLLGEGDSKAATRPAQPHAKGCAIDAENLCRLPR
jgi:hypothetical protein